MKRMSGLILIAAATLSGCQSTSSSMTEEQAELVNNVCRTGDNGKNDMKATWEEYKQALMDCGGYDIFTEDMLLTGDVLRTNSKGKTRVYTFNEDGTGTYAKDLGKPSDLPFTWELTQDGFISFVDEEAWKSTWALVGEVDNYWSVKFFSEAPDGSEQVIWSDDLVVMLDEEQ
ncbi:hypothetical protein L4C33_14920 [Vibrio makurazakiensis]|uniref:hypothetical protein n=1 Tax=Vibrio makurazakiensis TaxID=2910250 RepID=UPI003D0E0EA3